MSHPIECPSGLTGEIRRFKTRDYDLFSDRTLAKQNGPATAAAVCRQLWEQTTSPGPYQTDENGNPKWSVDVIEHDRFYIMMQARMMGPRGVNYDVDFMCDDDYCEERIPWTVDLRKLPVRKMSDEAKVGFANGNQFDLILPRCQKAVVYQLPTYDVQRRVALSVKEHGTGLSALYSGRLESVEGVTGRSRFYEFVRDLDAEDWEALDDAIESMDFGVDTAIEIECPSRDCLKMQYHEVMLGAGFFLPSRGDRKRRRATERKARRKLQQREDG